MTVDTEPNNDEYLHKLEAAFDRITSFEFETGDYWFFATPYSDYPAGTDRAFADTARFLGSFIVAGIPVFSPVVHAHPGLMVAQHYEAFANSPEFRAFGWMLLNRPFAEHASGLIVAELPGWQESGTVKAAFDFFLSANKPIVYLPVDTVML